MKSAVVRHNRILGGASAPLAGVVPMRYAHSLMDLDPQQDAIEGFHVDENEYHLGLATFDGRYKPAFERMKYFMQHH
jgi:hypothetical protein